MNNNIDRNHLPEQAWSDKHHVYYDPNPYYGFITRIHFITVKYNPHVQQCYFKNYFARISYGWGHKDPWAGYVSTNRNNQHIPRDASYFKELRRLALDYGAGNIFKIVDWLYKSTTGRISNHVLLRIKGLSQRFNNLDDLEERIYTSHDPKKYDGAVVNSCIFQYVLVVLYIAMVAEYHYYKHPEKSPARSVLTKRLKLIGAWQAISGYLKPQDAANWSRGRHWKEIDAYYQEIKNWLQQNRY